MSIIGRCLLYFFYGFTYPLNRWYRSNFFNTDSGSGSAVICFALSFASTLSAFSSSLVLRPFADSGRSFTWISLFYWAAIGLLGSFGRLLTYGAGAGLYSRTSTLSGCAGTAGSIIWVRPISTIGLGGWGGWIFGIWGTSNSAQFTRCSLLYACWIIFLRRPSMRLFSASLLHFS